MNDKHSMEASTYETILRQTAKKKGKQLKFSKTYPAYIVLIILIILSFAIYSITSDKIKSENSVSFDKSINSVMSRLDNHFQEHIQVLQSMRGLYDNLVQVVRDYFLLYGSVPVKTYSSIMNLMSIQKVEHINLEEYLHYVRSQGYYDYKIKPEGVRNSYFPVEFIVPDSDFGKMRGYDFATNPIIYEKIIAAKEKNIRTATPVFKFNDNEPASFFIISPIFKRTAPKSLLTERSITYESSVVLQINAELFFKNALSNSIPSDTSIIFDVTQDGINNKKEVIFTSSNYDLMKTGFKPILMENRILKIADREFQVNFYSTPGYGGELQKYLPALSLIISLILSSLFFMFILSVITSKARAVDLAERMTLSQRRIVMSSKDMIAVLDLNGVWKSMNPASSYIIGYEPYELIGQKIHNLIPDAEPIKELFETEISDEDQTKRIVCKMISKSGEIKWVSWSFTYSKSDSLIYCIGRDVTLEKLAEEESLLKAKQIQLAQQFIDESHEQKTYFLNKISHQFRNSLTTIIGYLQLLTNKIYETEEEREEYQNLIMNSSEHLFVYVSDMIEIAIGSGKGLFRNLTRITIDDVFSVIKENIRRELTDRNIVFEISPETAESGFFAVKSIVIESFMFLIKAITEGTKLSSIKVFAQENTYDFTTEIQILVSPSQLVSEMIDIYKKNLNALVIALETDKNDIILNFAICSSLIRMLNGVIIIETFGEKEENLAQITFPLLIKTEM